ncbi:MAG: DNA ligase-associated DEXH box helicase, partial [Leptolyngbya sp. SIO1D8]|nr:DNA ligase-associated DEXH box helicase [Leptolyngbya sp. SIO1D8]
NQAERWFQALSFAMPDHEDQIALHHGSIDFKEREAIEAGVKTGDVKWVVCTSSLDLGVDFQPVERVVQIGSAKNLARLLQRAGRSAHVPEGTSEVFFLPTNALELLEISAFRRGLAAGAIETRHPREKPYDVLVQHLVTLACGDGFEPQATLKAVKRAIAYQHLTKEEFNWVLEFIEKGGKCLGAYPRYQKVAIEEGAYRVTNTQISRMHRMGIGTITSNQAVRIMYTNRREIGTVEENFISRLKPGDVFFFAGRQLEFFQMKDMVVYVKNTRRQSTVTPTWGGGQLAISDTLSTHLRREVEWVRQSEGWNREVHCIAPILETQQRLSYIPAANELLVECCKTREGQHLYVFPFEGRFVHEGLGFLWGYRFARQQQTTFTISVNDYGFEILAPKAYPFQALFSEEFFSLENLEADIKASLNISELIQRKFRGVAQVAGLVFKGYPGSRKTSSQLQVSSSLLYEVFSKYEPDNLLLKQAEREVLREQLETHRLAETLKRLGRLSVVWQGPKRPSPLAFPLLVERLGTRMSNESLLERIGRLKQQWGKK